MRRIVPVPKNPPKTPGAPAVRDPRALPHTETTLAYVASLGNEWECRDGRLVDSRKAIQPRRDSDRPNPEAHYAWVTYMRASMADPRPCVGDAMNARQARDLKRWEARAEARYATLQAATAAAVKKGWHESVRQDAWDMLSDDKVGEFRLEKLARYTSPEINYTSNVRRPIIRA